MKQRSVMDLVVLGGGTAGWLTALYAKIVMPTKRITVIESDDIGILGAGEGATPHLITLLDILDIPVSHFIKETGATIKSSIKFTNWNNEGNQDYYHHSFNVYGNVAWSFYNQNVNYVQSSPSSYVAGCALGQRLPEYDLNSKLAKHNKVPFLYDERRQDVSNPIIQFEHISSFSIHFDAVKVASFLKKIAIERNINVVEGILENYKENEDGDIQTLILKSGKEIKSDFIIDCSGFNRFFPKAFDSEWVSYKDKLPVNSAIPFFLPMEEDSIPSYTEAIAMKYGWIWKIPLQERYGCGYVFDSTLINSEEAKKEVEEYLGFEIEVPRTLNFEPGYYKTPWVKNVISIGLSAGFVEPLEATSIWTSITTIGNLFSSPELIYRNDQRIVDDFNNRFCKLNEDILTFIYFHYMSERKDTPFWEKFTRENAPEQLKNLYDICDYRLLEFSDIQSLTWSIDSWYQVAIGTRQLNLEKFSKFSMFYNYTASFSKSNLVLLKKTQDELVEKYCPTHKEFLELLKGK